MSQTSIHNGFVLKLLSVFFIVILISCGTKKSPIQEVEIQKTNPKLLFINYTISKDTNNKKSIQFISKIIAEGKAKLISNKYFKTGEIGDIKCFQLDKDSTEINHVVIKNPFLKTIEFVNDSLTFESRKLTLNNAPISLRLQLNNKTTLIVISEIIDSLQNSKPLISTKLN